MKTLDFATGCNSLFLSPELESLALADAVQNQSSSVNIDNRNTILELVPSIATSTLQNS